MFFCARQQQLREELVIKRQQISTSAQQQIAAGVFDSKGAASSIA
jgi:hypothetical protein